jgi:methyl-accepting chemotaxis protein
MPAKTHGERLDRLDQIVQILAERHGDLEKLERIVADLATETRRGFDQVAAQFREISREAAERSREIDQRFRETAERFRETDERFRRTDEQLRGTNERIDKMVPGIGELIRSQNPPR